MPLLLESVGKRYGTVTALEGITLNFTPGVWGLVGPNGAGKSTLMAIVATLTRPTSGKVSSGPPQDRKEPSPTPITGDDDSADDPHGGGHFPLDPPKDFWGSSRIRNRWFSLVLAELQVMIKPMTRWWFLGAGIIAAAGILLPPEVTRVWILPLILICPYSSTWA